MAKAKTKLPDEQGWYWAESHDGDWYMAFVDTGQERVYMMDGENPMAPDITADFDDAASLGIRRWFGPFQCPGGDFGGHTVVIDAEMLDRAKRERKAIVLLHVDYKFCRDEKHGSSITCSSVVPRVKADEYVYRETEEIKAENAAAANKIGSHDA